MGPRTWAILDRLTAVAGELGALEVVLEREQEGVVLRELAEGPLGLVVQILVTGQLGQEAAHLAVTRHRCHTEEDLPRLVVLRDRLEGLDVVQP